MNPMNNFYLAEVAKATPYSGNAIHAWKRRGADLFGDNNEESLNPGGGRPLIYTLKTALTTVLAADLRYTGLAVEDAFAFALEFTHRASFDGLTKGGLPIYDCNPAELFENGETMFVVRFPLGDGEPIASVENVLPGENWKALGDEPAKVRSATVISLNALVARTQKALGLAA